MIVATPTLPLLLARISTTSQTMQTHVFRCCIFQSMLPIQSVQCGRDFDGYTPPNATSRTPSSPSPTTPATEARVSCNVTVEFYLMGSLY